MKKEQFVSEFISSLSCDNENLNKVARDSLLLGLDLINDDDYKNLKSIKSINKENYLKVSSVICAILNLKSSMTNDEEKTYKLIKEKCKTLDSNFSALIKESTTRLSGAMFYKENMVEGQ